MIVSGLPIIFLNVVRKRVLFPLLRREWVSLWRDMIKVTLAQAATFDPTKSKRNDYDNT